MALILESGFVWCATFHCFVVVRGCGTSLGVKVTGCVGV